MILMLLVPAVVVLFTVPVLFISPGGDVSREGGAVDHNWGGHAWSHANVTWALAAFAAIFYVRAGRPKAKQAWDQNRFGFLAWCAVVWGAIGFAIDGVLTAMVGDDTTWTHAFGLQAGLQFPFMLGLIFFGLPALVNEVRRPRRAPMSSVA